VDGWQRWASMSVLGVLLLLSPGPARAQEAASSVPAAEVEDVWFRSGDLLLHGYLYRPEGPGPFGAVIFSHGGGAREPRPAHRELAPFFVDAGYLFFAPERRGRGESPGEYVEELPMRESGTPNWSRLRVAAVEVEQYDVYDALEYLRGRPEVDTNRIVAAGWSTGAILSILGIEEDRGLRAGIVIAVTPNLWNQSSHVRERVLEAASRATAPLLLVHADDDV
jgi:carboxymethylenebutenolidase